MKYSVILKKSLKDFIEYMIWAITERQVVYKLTKLRRRPSKNIKITNGVSRGESQEDYIRKTYGIEKDVFIFKLHREEFWAYWYNFPLKYIYQKIRQTYAQFFIDDMKTIVTHCISKGYIKEYQIEGKTYYKDTPDGKKLLSIWYFPKKLLEYEPFRDLLGKVIKLGVFIFLGIQIIKHF